LAESRCAALTIRVSRSKIIDVRAHVLEAPLSEAFSYSRAWYSSRTCLIVKITTDAGLVGGASVTGRRASMPRRQQHEARAYRRGFVPNRVALARDLCAFSRPRGLSGIDIALWDIKGKALGEPVHRLMGGPIRTDVAAYATGPYRRQGTELPGSVREVQ
jgi:D-galactarolactone cycloisomerase